MSDLFTDYLRDLCTQMEKVQVEQYRPHCRDCGEPITGTSYNGRCQSCASKTERDEQ